MRPISVAPTPSDISCSETYRSSPSQASSGPQKISSGSQTSTRPKPKPKVLKPIDSRATLPASTSRSAHEIFWPYFCLTGHSRRRRSEEHTSELQSRQYLVCRLLLEKKKKIRQVNLST